MKARGRPLRFLALVAIGWTGMRVALLWPVKGSLPAAIEAAVPLLASSAVAPRASAGDVAPRAAAPPGRSPAAPRHSRSRSAPVADPARVQMALLALVQYGAPAFAEGPAWAPAPRPLAPAPSALPGGIDPLPDRWSASAWMAMRPGTGLGAAPGANQLGGSQAGARLAYMLAPGRRILGFARLTAPLRGRGREAALGLEWQPAAAPVRLVLEHRVGLDGTRGGPALGIVAGLDRRMRGFRLEAYGQAGLIRRARTERYADGAARFTRALGEARRTEVALGAGVWGAAQRDAARLDFGPTATLALPLAGGGFRIAIDWRQRIAGSARPGSGPALVLGGDF